MSPSKREEFPMREPNDAQLENLTASIQDLTKSIDALTVQVVQLTAQQKQTASNLDRLNEAVQGHLKVAESHSNNISKLSDLVATQAATVDFLIRRSA